VLYTLSIYANIRPILDDENRFDHPLYRKLEIYMQRLGCLLAYREQLNWKEEIDSIELGDAVILKRLKKVAAKNDGVPLLYAVLTNGTVYQHLIGHPNSEGIYLPFDFSDPFYIKHNNNKLWVGSTLRLQEELNWLEMTMENQAEDICSYWSKLRTACQLSIEHTSPMILFKG
jgi:hypothetical protein